VLHCVAVCCGVLMLQSGAVFCSVFEYIALSINFCVCSCARTGEWRVLAFARERRVERETTEGIQKYKDVECKKEKRREREGARDQESERG